ncbi:TrbI/VirB10 family protein [Pukyongiella litopenaei]|uniref:Conjugal transfer protein TraB n=1 Tax=Pukyongiella litopenaei TaxID=2605946 RepID=A0A5C2H1W9_9RHOB|nr:TrbI/VirB10 family protein [Pukyongiella litopenaei]QEP30434.1 conjugal transfer protein TraB [Pukyongiella litopenaei]
MSVQPDRKKKQVVAIGVLGAVVLALFLGLGALMGPPNGSVITGVAPVTVDETIISDRTAAASPEMSWITQGRVEMERLRQEMEEQRKLLEQARSDAQTEVAAIREEYDEQILQQATRIVELEQELTGRAQDGAAADNGGGDRPLTGREKLERRIAAEGPGTDFIERRPPTRAAARGAQRVDADGNAVSSGFGQSFTLAAMEAPEVEEREVRTLGSYLPAGSYAPAVVLSGADASTNVSNRENPIPVLFRITGPAVSAAVGGRGPAKVNLKGCTVQGSATGDLSSERVKVRLIGMTCVNRHGAVLETKVAGYMAGSGKEGVRGQVVSREGPQMRNALAAGLLGGLGSTLNAAATAQMFQDTASTQELLRGAGVGAVAGGAESAANTLADYYVKRAEQYQPVVSLYGGTRVELVFLEGVELKG